MKPDISLFAPHVAGAILALAVGALLCSGCSTIQRALDAYDAHRGGQEQPTTPPGPVGGSPVGGVDAATPSIPADQADFSSFSWRFGGFNGARATPSGVIISSFKTAPNMVYYRFERDLSAWGIKDPAAADALVCAFVQDATGSWVGGKFDWVSSSRTTRNLDHLGTRTPNGYSGWTLAGIPNPTQFAFVIVSADGRRRSNVLAAEWRR